MHLSQYFEKHSTEGAGAGGGGGRGVYLFEAGVECSIFEPNTKKTALQTERPGGRGAYSIVACVECGDLDLTFRKTQQSRRGGAYSCVARVGRGELDLSYHYETRSTVGGAARSGEGTQLLPSHCPIGHAPLSRPSIGRSLRFFHAINYSSLSNVFLSCFRGRGRGGCTQFVPYY